jgi:hypothetical protein
MKIWFDRSNLDVTSFASEQFLLTPFFNKRVIKENKDFKNAEYWIQSISFLIQETDIEDADVLVYHNKLDINISNTIQLANQYNKPVLAFYNDDNVRPAALPKCVDLYRTSLYKSKQKDNEYSFPAWSEDFGTPERLSLRPKNIKPTVSFCGAFTYHIRQKAITQLKKNSDIETSFIIRNNFWGGRIHDLQLREDYIDNINTSDLVLCCRGAGNFSYRLYETMSLGRVPVIIDTDIVLPCEDIIDWESICIRVKNIEDINSSINNFWNKISYNEYISMQSRIRQTYEQFICPPGFTRYLLLKYSK